MSNNIAEFCVGSLDSSGLVFNTVVDHCALGEREVIRIEQSGVTDGESDVVILDKADFMSLYNQLKGH